MAEVLAIVSGKGGVGKTTAVANIGTALAAMGKRVLLIDGDVGLRNLDVALGMSDRVVYDYLDVIEDRCDVTDAMVKDSRFAGLSLLAAPQSSEPKDVPIAKLKAMVDGLRPYFDYIIFDAPAGTDEGFKLSVGCSDQVVLVTTPELTAVRDADRTVGRMEELGVEKIFIIINRISVDMVQKGDMIDIDSIVEAVAAPLLGAVPEGKEVVASINKGKPVVLDSRSRAGRAYANIAKRITGVKVPILDDERTGIKKFLYYIFH